VSERNGATPRVEEIAPLDDCSPEVREWWEGVKQDAQDPKFWEPQPITVEFGDSLSARLNLIS